jgi:hypothetical protein
MTPDEFIGKNQDLLKESLMNQTLAITWFWNSHQKKKSFTFSEMIEILKYLQLDHTNLHVVWGDLVAMKRIHMPSFDVYRLDSAVQRELDMRYHESEAMIPGNADELLDEASSRLTAGHIVEATTLAGGALETHLLNVITKSGATPPNPGSISAYKDFIARARKAGSLPAFSDSDLSHIIGWGQDRNDAAHQPTAFRRGQQDVRLMIDGIRNLVSRTQ